MGPDDKDYSTGTVIQPQPPCGGEIMRVSQCVTLVACILNCKGWV